MKSSLSRRVAAEFLGTAFLVAAVVGSGIMGERLANGNAALALLANAIATGAALAALILTLRPISGAHLNPVVSLAEGFRGGLPWRDAGLYVIAQFGGGILGTACADVMFALPPFTLSQRARTGAPQWLSEFVATFGLILVIRACSRFEPKWIPIAVACYITAAYWFTASTSFANPAVTIARSLTDTFAGIRPVDVPPFLAAQLSGGLAAVIIFEWMGFKSGGA
jgi:glycerol uptake facilitator-like aquaporin